MIVDWLLKGAEIGITAVVAVAVFLYRVGGCVRRSRPCGRSGEGW